MEKVTNTVRRREIGTVFFGWPSCYFLPCQTDRRTGRVSSYCRPGWLGNIANIKPRQQRGASRLRLSSIAWPEPYRMSEWVTLPARVSAHAPQFFFVSESLFPIRSHRKCTASKSLLGHSSRVHFLVFNITSVSLSLRTRARTVSRCLWLVSTNHAESAW